MWYMSGEFRTSAAGKDSAAGTAHHFLQLNPLANANGNAKDKLLRVMYRASGVG